MRQSTQSALLRFSFLFVALLIACNSDKESTNTPYGLNADLQGDPPERTWTEPDVKKTATLSSGEDYTIFNPASIYLLENDRVYVPDAGDYKLKAFTPEGRYLKAYGEGEGNAPGEVRVYKEVGLWNDSLYVLDSRTRRLSFFGKDTEFGRSEQFQHWVENIAWAADSTRYEWRNPARKTPTLRILPTSGPSDTLSNIQARDVTFVFGGRFLGLQRRAVFVPLFYPLLLTFAPGDTVATAHPTPDYGEAPLPEPEPVGGGRRRPPSPPVHVWPTMQDGVLAVQLPSPPPPKDSIRFDLYDSQTFSYMHSVRFPLSNDVAQYAHEDGLLVIERDTTVELYRVENR